MPAHWFPFGHLQIVTWKWQGKWDLGEGPRLRAVQSGDHSHEGGAEQGPQTGSASPHPFISLCPTSDSAFSSV